MSTKKCTECGCDIPEESLKCPFCGYQCQESLVCTTTENFREEEAESSKKYRYFGIVACVAACILFAVAFTRINNSKYQFYKEHYEACILGYEDSKSSAETNGLLLKGTYLSIADEYQNMAKEDLAKMNEFRLQAGLLCGVGVILLIAGIYFIKHQR